MKSVLVVTMLMLAVWGGQVWADVRFISRNPAVRGGFVRITFIRQAVKVKICSARFMVGQIETAQGKERGWIAVLPCDLPEGGQVVVRINGRPKEFWVPAGVVLHGRSFAVAMVEKKYGLAPVIHPMYFGLDFDEESSDRFFVDFESDTGWIRCSAVAHVAWPPNVDSYEAYAAYKEDRVQRFLTRYQLPCSGD